MFIIWPVGDVCIYSCRVLIHVIDLGKFSPTKGIAVSVLVIFFSIILLQARDIENDMSASVFILI